ncbi:hypothetical protein cypCar_00006258 [Cyprinus carpio]|nr:hypothetical protein cypCar_00006258 [Cyprinus carpio]
MGTLSDQQMALTKGQNPLPIYTALNMKNNQFYIKKLSVFLTSRPIISQMFNFLRGLHLHRNYSKNCDFTAWKGQNIIYVVIKQTQEYCADHKISFPKIDYRMLESEPIGEIYVFEDKENPDVPIVLHFPLVNISFRQLKSPGEYRQLLPLLSS